MGEWYFGQNFLLIKIETLLIGDKIVLRLSNPAPLQLSSLFPRSRDPPPPAPFLIEVDIRI